MKVICSLSLRLVAVVALVLLGGGASTSWAQADTSTITLDDGEVCTLDADLAGYSCDGRFSGPPRLIYPPGGYYWTVTTYQMGGQGVPNAPQMLAVVACSGTIVGIDSTRPGDPPIQQQCGPDGPPLPDPDTGTFPS